MAFQTIDRGVATGDSGGRRGDGDFVSLHRNKLGSRLMLSASMVRSIGAAERRIVFEYDQDERILMLRPATDDERGWKLFDIGGSRTSRGANRGVSCTALEKHLGVDASFSGRLPARAEGNRILVDLHPALDGKST